jgi:DNA-binding transcriptional LysR family regulator
MGSFHLCCALLASGPFLAILPGSRLHFGANLPSLKVLPVNMPIPHWPVGIMTLKNRTISPVTQLFIECAREVVKPLAKGNNVRHGLPTTRGPKEVRVKRIHR